MKKLVVLVALVAAMAAKADYWMTFCKTPGGQQYSQFGSRAWGFASPDSDYDVRGVFVKPLDWYLQLKSDVPDTIVEELPGDIDVLVTHSPPRIPDSDVDRSLQTDLEHFGSPELKEATIEKRPRLVFCGHIHTGQHGGVDFEGSRIYNVSRLDERYEIAYEPTWVEV